MMASTQSDQYDTVVSIAAQGDHCEQELQDPQSSSTLDLTAFVSCYNEADYIIQTLDDIRLALHEANLSFEIIIVDDCSSDDSFARVKSYIEEHPVERIILRSNRVNKGLAQNYIDAAFIGKGRYYKLFCGDNTEPKDSIVKICQLIGQADMIIVNYCNVEGKSGFRQWLSSTYTRLINLISGNSLRYYNGLALHLRYNIMRWHPNTRGFGFQADIICMLLDQGASYLEVSVPAINRTASKALSRKNILSVGHTILDLLIRRVANRIYSTPATRRAVTQRRESLKATSSNDSNETYSNRRESGGARHAVRGPAQVAALTKTNGISIRL